MVNLLEAISERDQGLCSSKDSSGYWIGAKVNFKEKASSKIFREHGIKESAVLYEPIVGHL